MHGLIFVTWEKYLAERFRGSVLKEYRDAIGESPETAPLSSRVYEDAVLLAGVATASGITRVPAETLLREFGHYFILNGLTRHLCAYLLTQVHSARELLLTMHDAHEQMSRLPEGLTPPLFEYLVRSTRPDELIIAYDSPRKLCSVLLGAIEGAAERYNEKITVVEQMCMKRGNHVCRFKVRFIASSAVQQQETPEQLIREQSKRRFAQFILSCLPEREGITLEELQSQLVRRGLHQKECRPALLLEALRHLQFAGLVATTANQPGEQFVFRRYWRAATSDAQSSQAIWPQNPLTA
jgi:predicted hydrocarbon binding protein